MYYTVLGEGRSSVVDRPLNVRWVVGSIPLGAQIKLFVVLASAPQLVKKGDGMYYAAYVIMHIKEPLLLMGNSVPCTGGSGFPFVICMVLNHMSHDYITLNKMVLIFFSFFTILHCAVLYHTIFFI